MDHRVAGVEVDRRPAIVSVWTASGCSAAQIVASQPPWQSPDQVDRPAEPLHGAVDHFEVVLDRRVRVSRPAPIQSSEHTRGSPAARMLPI